MLQMGPATACSSATTKMPSNGFITALNGRAAGRAHVRPDRQGCFPRQGLRKLYQPPRACHPLNEARRTLTPLSRRAIVFGFSDLSIAVIPAEAGIQGERRVLACWIPACARMTAERNAK